MRTGIRIGKNDSAEVKAAKNAERQKLKALEKAAKLREREELKRCKAAENKIVKVVHVEMQEPKPRRIRVRTEIQEPEDRFIRVRIWPPKKVSHE
jgi:hypothetical protein